jgi:hypothetical protein
MTDAEKGNQDPGAIVHLVGVIAGAVSAWLAASFLGSYSSPLVALVIGGIAGVAGVFIRQGFREALATSIVVIIVAFIVFKMFAEGSIFRTVLIPAALGFSTGTIVGATWKELTKST